MRHEEIWHSCDRCGKKIKHLPQRRIMYFGTKKKYTELSVEDEASYWANDDIGILIRVCDKEQKHYELCEMCSKEFQNFMNGEQ